MTKAEFDILKHTATMQEGINMVVVNRVSLDQMFEIFKIADMWFEDQATQTHFQGPIDEVAFR